MSRFRINDIEKKYIHNYIQSNRKLILLGSILLFIFTSDRFFLSGLVGLASNMFLNGGYYGNVNSTTNLYFVLLFFVSAVAFFLAIYQYRFLNNRSSCDLYLSLPIKRERLYFLQYIIGACALVVCTFGVYLLSLLVGYGEVNFLEALSIGALIEILGLASYSLMSWINIKCNSTFDAIVVSILYMILPVLLHMGLRAFLTNIEGSIYTAQSFSSSYDTDTALLMTNFLSPVWLGRSIIESMSGEYPLDFIKILSFAAVIFWMLLGYFLYLKGKQAFLRKRSEQCGQRTKALMTYPILIPAFTLILLLAFSAWPISIIASCIIFIVYVLLTFFAQREIKFRSSMFLIYLALVLVVQGSQYVLVKTEAFGVLHEIPNYDEIGAVELGISHINGEWLENSIIETTIESYSTVSTRPNDFIKEFHQRTLEYSTKNISIGDAYSYYQVSFQFYNKSFRSETYLYYLIPSHYEQEMKTWIQTLTDEDIITSDIAESAEEE